MRSALLARVCGLAAVACFLLAACGTAEPSPVPALTPAPGPAGWTFQGWTDPALELAVPSSWTNNGEIEPEAVTSPDPSLGPKQAAMTAAINAITEQGGYRTNIGGIIETPLGEAAPGYIEVLVEQGDWRDLDGFADHWEAATALLARERLEPVVLPAGPAEVFEVDDVFESGYPLRARWYLFVLPDGRGMAISFGTYAGEEAGDRPASLETLRAFAEQSVATLRPAR